MQNPITEIILMIREVLIEITKIIKKIKRVNFDIIKEISLKTTSKDLHYSESKKIYYKDYSNNHRIEISKSRPSEIINIIKKICDDKVIYLYENLIDIKSFRFPENSGRYDFIIRIEPEYDGSSIIMVMSTFELVQNIDILYYDILEYKKYLENILENNKKIKKEILKYYN